MAELKKHPSLPSNYVTLGQLQERWIKEQQQKQKEIEEERERKEREKREAEENQKQREIRERSETINKSVSIGRRPFPRNRPNPSEKNRRFGKVGKSVEAKIEEEQQRKERENEDQERKLEDEKNQKRNEIRERSENINNSVSIDRRSFRRNIGNQSEKNRRTVAVGESNSVEAEIGAVIVVGEAIRERSENINNSVSIDRQFRRNSRNQSEKNRRTVEVGESKSVDAEIGAVIVVGEAIRERSENINNSVSIDRQFRRNSRNQSEKNRRTVEVGESKSVDAEIGAVIVVGEAINDQREKTTELKKKRRNGKKKNWEKKGKPRAQENLIEGTIQLSPEKAPEGKERKSEKVALHGEGSENQREGKEIAVVVTRRKGEREGNGNGRGFRRNERNSTVNPKIWEHKTPVDPSVQTELKFEGLTLTGGTVGNEEPVMVNNGGHLKYNSGYRGYNHWNEWKPPRYCNLAWIKKGEVSDAHATGIQNSGSLAKVKARTRYT